MNTRTGRAGFLGSRLTRVLAPDGDPGAGGSDWRSSIPEDLRKAEALADVKDVATLAKNYVETKAFVGQSLRIPGPEAGPEAKKAFLEKLHAKVPNVVYMPETDEEKSAVEAQLWQKLGRPADAKGYSLEGVDLGGVELDVAGLAQTAAEMGLTKSQFVELAKRQAAAQAAHAKALETNRSETKKAWGAAYDSKISTIADIAAKLDTPAETINAIKAGELPLAQLKVWDKVVEAVGGQGRAAGDHGRGDSGAITPDEARERIAEIQGNPAYWNRGANADLHEVLKAKMLKYQGMLADLED